MWFMLLTVKCRAFMQYKKHASLYREFVEARFINAYWHCIEPAAIISSETDDATVNATVDATVDITEATDGLLPSEASIVEDHVSER